MYFNSFCPAISRNDRVCGSSKIFRPWDLAAEKVVAQDSTVSTTTDCDEAKKETEKDTSTEKISENYIIKNKRDSTDFHTEHKQSNSKLSQLKPINASPLLQEYISPTDYSLYPELLHTNFAQTLGIPSADSLFLESVAHGYALEEYARVLTQDHQAKILSGKKQRPKKYKCPHCDVGFSNNGQLKGHIRIHTGERPFKCDEKNCGKTFTRNEELTRHKRIHSGLRPFPCTQCGKRFGRKDHLKKHSRTHLQPKGLYAVPVMLPIDTWGASSAVYPYIPMFGY